MREESLLALACIVILGSIASLFLNVLFRSRRPNAIYLAVFLFTFSGLVTHTPDWDGYSYWMEYDVGRDIFFRFLSRFLIENNLGYSQLHMIYALSYSSLLVYLGSKITKSYFLLIVMYYSIIYLLYTTQIRFYLAYFLFCIGIYHYFLTKRVLFSVIIFIAAVANHSSVMLLIPIIALTHVDPRKMGLYIIGVGFLLWFVFQFTSWSYMLPSASEYFTEYTSSGVKRSGLLGATLAFGPYAASAALLLRAGRKNRDCYEAFVRDKTFKYAWYMAVTPMIYLPIAASTQVIGQRFIVSSLIFHFFTWFLLIRMENRHKKGTRFTLMIFAWLIFASSTYLIPSLLKVNNYWGSSLEVFSSNSLLN